MDNIKDQKMIGAKNGQIIKELKKMNEKEINGKLEINYHKGIPMGFKIEINEKIK